MARTTVEISPEVIEGLKGLMIGYGKMKELREKTGLTNVTIYNAVKSGRTSAQSLRKIMEVVKTEPTH